MTECKLIIFSLMVQITRRFWSVTVECAMNAFSPEVLLQVTHILQRLADRSAACKIWSIVLVTIVLLFAIGRAGGEYLLWAAAPTGLLAFADAAYLAKARRIASFVNQSNDHEFLNLKQLIHFQSPEEGVTTSLKSMMAIFPLSVLPFYLCLAGLVAGIGLTVLGSKPKDTPVSQGTSQQTSPNAYYPAKAAPTANGVKPNYPPAVNPTLIPQKPGIPSPLPSFNGQTPPQLPLSARQKPQQPTSKDPANQKFPPPAASQKPTEK